MRYPQLLNDQIELRSRPMGRVVMYQQWKSLCFFHFSCPAAEIQALLPEGLTVDTWPDRTGEEMAWIGLVPFRMANVRPRGLPAVPNLSSFPETNVRTYVHLEGRAPGVWFFSLDAANSIACRIARRFFSLPYYEATMSVDDRSDTWRYESKRSSGDGGSRIEAKIGNEVASAVPGTLEFFLLERYLLYSFRQGRFYSGRVHHAPYPLSTIVSSSVEQSLVAANKITARSFCHQIASEGVEVEVFGLELCRSRTKESSTGQFNLAG